MKSKQMAHADYGLVEIALHLKRFSKTLLKDSRFCIFEVIFGFPIKFLSKSTASTRGGLSCANDLNLTAAICCYRF